MSTEEFRVISGIFMVLHCFLPMQCQLRQSCMPLGKEHQCGWESYLTLLVPCVRPVFNESRSLEVECKFGGKGHLKLNKCLRPIVHKYHEGKVKRTLERELKVPDIAGMEANGNNVLLCEIVVYTSLWCLLCCRKWCSWYHQKPVCMMVLAFIICHSSKLRIHGETLIVW